MTCRWFKKQNPSPTPASARTAIDELMLAAATAALPSLILNECEAKTLPAGADISELFEASVLNPNAGRPRGTVAIRLQRSAIIIRSGRTVYLIPNDGLTAHAPLICVDAEPGASNHRIYPIAGLTIAAMQPAHYFMEMARDAHR